MRNAVEHPSGNSGHLHIHNFELLSENHPEYPKVIEPAWHLNDEPAVSIAMDLFTYTDNLLMFCEDILVACMMNKGMPKILRICEIPETERNSSAPIRLKIVLKKETI